MVRLIKRHWKVCQCSTGFPLPHYGLLFSIYYRDLSRIRNIDEDPGTFFLKLKRLGMRVELDVAKFISAQIKDSKSATAVAYIDLVGECIKTNIVRVFAVLDRLQELKRTGIVNPAGAILRASDKEPVVIRQIEHALWLMQPGNGV